MMSRHDHNITTPSILDLYRISFYKIVRRAPPKHTTHFYFINTAKLHKSKLGFPAQLMFEKGELSFNYHYLFINYLAIALLFQQHKVHCKLYMMTTRTKIGFQFNNHKTYLERLAPMDDDNLDLAADV